MHVLNCAASELKLLPSLSLTTFIESPDLNPGRNFELIIG